MYTWILLQIKFTIIVSCSTKLKFIIRQVIKFFIYTMCVKIIHERLFLYILVSLRTRYVIGAIDPFAILRSSIFSLSISIIGLVDILIEACFYCTIFSTISLTLVANQDYRVIMENYIKFFDRDLRINFYYQNIFCLELEKLRAN